MARAHSWRAISTVFALWITGLVPCAQAASPSAQGANAALSNETLFSDMGYRVAYCKAVIESRRPSTSGGHLPDFFAWPGYPAAMLKWKAKLNRLDDASRGLRIEAARSKAAFDLAAADLRRSPSPSSDAPDAAAADAAWQASSDRIHEAACEPLDWLP